MTKATIPHAPPSWLNELKAPFIGIWRAPGAIAVLLIINILEGLAYFGFTGYATPFMTQEIGLKDPAAAKSLILLTGGITISMFFFGKIADRLHIRTVMLGSQLIMLTGRILMASSVLVSAEKGLWSPRHLTLLAGFALVALAYGPFQPGLYAATSRLSGKLRDATLYFAAIYASMNLGSFANAATPPLRQKIGISGMLWIFVGVTLLNIIYIYFKLTDQSIKRVEKMSEEAVGEGLSNNVPEPEKKLEWEPARQKSNWKTHPLLNPRFLFLIFSLMFVQTLFAHNWLTIPDYLLRAYKDNWMGQWFESVTHINPIGIVLVTPIVAYWLSRSHLRMYDTLILGTFVMGAPAFILVLGPIPGGFLLFTLISTVGEAIWQPLFLQYATKIAPPGQEASYSGIANFPWFLTKTVTPLFSGWFMATYCPQDGQLRTETMWFWYGLIAITTPVLLLATRFWIMRDKRYAGAPA